MDLVIDDTLQSLQVRGVLKDCVVGVSVGTQYIDPNLHEDAGTDLDTEDWERIKSNVFPWYLRFVEFISRLIKTGLSQSLSLSRLMCHGHDGIVQREPNTLNQEHCVPVFEQWLAESRLTFGSAIEQSTVLMALTMALRFNIFCRDEIDRTRVLASMSKARLGWIPELARSGDAVALLGGAPYPFILRRRQDGYYSVVGDAYIEGIMHGEAWPPDDKTGVEWIGIK